MMPLLLRNGPAEIVFHVPCYPGRRHPALLWAPGQVGDPTRARQQEAVASCQL